MAEQLFPIDEGPQSPDLFSDWDQTQDSFGSPNLDESFPCTSKVTEPEPPDDTPEWKGVSMDEIYRGLGPFDYQQHPPITPSEFHTVLFRLPVNNRGPPKPFPTHPNDKWGVNYVRMPHSSHSLYPIEKENRPRELRLRWEVIQEALLQNFISCAQLEAAILSYNDKYAQRWDFSALRKFFSDVMDEEDTEMFFENLLPKIIQLALQLPTLITGAIPLLKKNTNNMISLSQLQVASLLANAFFCTFPRRNSTHPQSEYGSYPYINFNRLFSAYREERPNRSAAVSEKLKCLFHYFRRVTSAAPEGTITIQRRYLSKEDCPRWHKMSDQLPSFHITSKGTIESEGTGMLQVDFANKYVGGGVLNWGCVQEEIRFVICPELMVTMLVTEALGDTEALIISGVERYSKYEGYSNTFKWTGDFIDETPRDTSKRRMTSIVAIDALSFSQADAQFNMENVIRELNKAYVGFSSSEMPPQHLSAIATGNWGCGAFRGDPKLKVLIQLMAAAAAKRSMVYFTFGNTALRESIAEMYWHLVHRNMEIGQLFSLLRQYESESTTDRSDFFRFLFNRSKMKPLTKYFNVMDKNKEPEKSKEFPNKRKVFGESSNIKAVVEKYQSLQEGDEELDGPENGRIRSLIDNCEINEDVTFVKAENLPKGKSPIAKKKKASLWDVLAENESEKDRIQTKPVEQRYPELDFLSLKSVPKNSGVFEENPKLVEASSKTENSDFFSIIDDCEKNGKSTQKNVMKINGNKKPQSHDKSSEQRELSEKILEELVEKRYPKLNFLATNTEINSEITIIEDTSSLQDVVTPNHLQSPTGQKKSSKKRRSVKNTNQRKISDFFPLKNS